jgi:glycosyltransferase involved in cell wall biosynthesis
VQHRIFAKNKKHNDIFIDSLFDKRKEKLVNSQKKRILYIFPTPDSAIYKHRVLNQIEIINKSSKYHAECFFYNELGNIDFLDNVELCNLVRCKWVKNLEKFIDQVLIRKIKITFDCDDLVFHSDFAAQINEQLEVVEDESDFWFAETSRIYEIAKKSDFFTTTNGYLAGRLYKYFNKPTFVIRNHLDLEQIDLAQKINAVEVKKEKKIIGYFSGSSTHDKDFKVAEDGLLKILADNNDVILRIVGPLNINKQFDKFKDQIERIDLLPHDQLQKSISECYINIVPLVINEFTNCKSELKFFSAGIVKVPTIASPTYVYKKAINDNIDGIIAQDDEWYEKISLLLNNKELYNTISQNSYATGIKNYSGEIVLQEKLAVLDEIMKAK